LAVPEQQLVSRAPDDARGDHEDIDELEVVMEPARARAVQVSVQR
jgi:hypothetical protein